MYFSFFICTFAAIMSVSHHCLFARTKVSEISDIRKCLLNFYNQALAILIKLLTADIRFREIYINRCDTQKTI